MHLGHHWVSGCNCEAGLSVIYRSRVACHWTCSCFGFIICIILLTNWSTLTIVLVFWLGFFLFSWLWNFLFLRYKLNQLYMVSGEVIGNNKNFKFESGWKAWKWCFFQYSTLLKESREGIDMCVTYKYCTFMILSLWSSCQENKLKQKLRYTLCLLIIESDIWYMYILIIIAFSMCIFYSFWYESIVYFYCQG